MAANQRIAIIGAGIGGLSAALGLSRAGHSVEVYESAPAWADIGAGVTLAPNAMRGFDYLGVGDAVAAAGVEPQTQTVAHWEDGRILLTLERGERMVREYGARYVYIHRADLHAILVRAVADAGGRVHIGARAETVETARDGSRIHFAEGAPAEADLIIGADGLKSVVRRLFEPASAQFTGHVAFRALAPVDERLADLARHPGMHIGPGRMMVRYPVRGGSVLNLVFFARQDGWNEDGWTIPATRAELRALFAGWCDDIQAMIDRAPEDKLFKWAINARTPLATWRTAGAVTLLGDAAHAMTPFLGQGAATAIEDAVVLTRALAAASDVPEALERYEAARHERTSFIQLESNANADRLQGQDTNLYGLGDLRNEESLGLFSYDCATVPV